MAKNASRVPYITIIVLVAVVAAVVLVLNFRPSSEEAVAGEATSILASPKCSYVSLYPDQPFNHNYYMNTAYKSNKTFQKFCQDNNAKSCTSVDLVSYESVYSENDCGGSVLWRSGYQLWDSTICNLKPSEVPFQDKTCNGGIRHMTYPGSETIWSLTFVQPRGILCCS